VTEQIARVIWMLCQTVSERFSFRVRTLSKEQVEYIVNRVLLPARKRFRRVVEQIRAGKPPKVRARKPREPRPVKPKRKTIAAMEREVERESRTPLPRGWRRWARADRVRARAEKRAAKELEARLRAAENRPVPVWRTLRMHRRGWLCALAPQIFDCRYSAAFHAKELRRLLAEPEMRALLMANRYAGDSLRRVCWALGVEESLLYDEPSAPAAPVVAEPEPAIMTPAEIDVSAPPDAAQVFAAPESAASVTPDEQNQFSGTACVPAPPAVAGDVPSSQTLPGAPAKGDFFKWR
jgi:hypothetical protein